MPPIHSIIAIFAPAAIAAAPVPQVGEVTIFKDWAVGCDNGGTCQAISLLPDMGGPGYDEHGGPITIVRTGDAEDRLKIRVLIAADGIDRYRMSVDGELVDTGAVVEGDYPIEIVGTDALKVADAIIRGRELSVTGPSDEVLTKISLAGSAAANALCRCRAKQGRHNDCPGRKRPQILHTYKHSNSDDCGRQVDRIRTCPGNQCHRAAGRNVPLQG